MATVCAICGAATLQTIWSIPPPALWRWWWWRWRWGLGVGAKRGWFPTVSLSKTLTSWINSCFQRQFVKAQNHLPSCTICFLLYKKPVVIWRRSMQESKWRMLIWLLITNYKATSHEGRLLLRCQVLKQWFLPVVQLKCLAKSKSCVMGIIQSEKSGHILHL